MYLSNVCGFSTHVGASDNLELALALDQRHVVWYETNFILYFETWMASFFEDQITTTYKQAIQPLAKSCQG